LGDPADRSAPAADRDHVGWLGWLGVALSLGGVALALAIGAVRPDGELSGAVLILSQAVALVAGGMSRRRSRAGSRSCAPAPSSRWSPSSSSPKAPADPGVSPTARVPGDVGALPTSSPPRPPQSASAPQAFAER
jgi:drug/metabolite transporter (DMT)-like permease